MGSLEEISFIKQLCSLNRYRSAIELNERDSGRTGERESLGFEFDQRGIGFQSVRAIVGEVHQRV